MNTDLSTYSTFKLGGTAHKVFSIEEKNDVEKVHQYASEAGKPLIIIGEGSNSIFSDSVDKYVIGVMQIKRKEIMEQIKITDTEKQIESTSAHACVRAGGGENWDELVSWTIAQGFSGLEALSGIPGTVGASPIQNIGAYGSELADTFVSAEVFDRKEEKWKTFSPEDCEFSYRDSTFKRNPNRYIITSIILKLSTAPASIPEYKAVQVFFQKNTINFKKPTTQEIRDAIIQIRNSKLPDYKIHPNCGSFFKNPIISQKQLDQLRNKYLDIPHFEMSDTAHLENSQKKIKLYAGWLIEHVNYLSAQTEHIIFNPKNKLVLIHNGHGSYEELQRVISNISDQVRDAFGVTLEVEPNLF